MTYLFGILLLIFLNVINYIQIYLFLSNIRQIDVGALRYWRCRRWSNDFDGTPTNVYFIFITYILLIISLTLLLSYQSYPIIYLILLTYSTISLNAIRFYLTSYILYISYSYSLYSFSYLLYVLQFVIRSSVYNLKAYPSYICYIALKTVQNVLLRNDTCLITITVQMFDKLTPNSYAVQVSMQLLNEFNGCL